MKDICLRTFLLIWIEHLNFLPLNLEIALSLFFNRWDECKSSGVTSCPVKEIALHTAFSKTLSPVSLGTGLTSTDYLLRYWELLTAFRSYCVIRWCRKVFQFFVVTSLDFNSSCFEAKVPDLSFNAFNWFRYQITEVAVQSILLWSDSQLNFLQAPC